MKECRIGIRELKADSEEMGHKPGAWWVQRMNCFNIRELQGILKRRFFNDLVNSNDHHTLLNDSMIGIRFKLNNTQNIEPDIFTFYNFGTTDVSKFKSQSLKSTYSLQFFEESLSSYLMSINFMHYLPNLSLLSI